MSALRAGKREAILDAAAAVFLRHGYVGTSMDEVAARAAVSKQTVYKHFADKERLFAELVVMTVQEASDRVHDEALGLADSGDIAADLRDLARRLAAMVLQPDVLRLRRLVIGEAGRFPDLGRTFYELGPGRTIDALATAVRELAERGALRAHDPLVAAEHFNWLVLAAPLNRAMLLGDESLPSPDELARYADEAVRVFLAAYAPAAPPPSPS